MPAKPLPRHCGKAMKRLYIRKGTDKREWKPVGFYCSVCSRVFKEEELKVGKRDWIDRVVLKGVPWIGFTERPDGSYELEPFCSSLKACLQYMGEDVSYTHVMGTSGAAFRLMWNSKFFDGGNVSLNVVAKDQFEPFRRAFKAVGRECTIIGNSDYIPPKPVEEVPWMFKDFRPHEYIRERIIESIRDQGRPVLAFGVVGPPESCIIAGYDNNGDVLIGWNYFQGGPGAEFIQKAGDAVGAPAEQLGMTEMGFEPSGYFRQPTWFRHTPGIIQIGERTKSPRKGSIYRSSLKWALKIVQTSMVNDFYGGLRAYKAWAEALQDDNNFPSNDIDALMRPMMCHSDALTMVGEGRFNAEIFLKEIAESESKMRKDLLAAAKCYREEFGLTWECWKLLGPRPGNTPAHAQKLADPDIRNQTIPIILQCREKDEKAAHHIEKALER